MKKIHYLFLILVIASCGKVKGRVRKAFPPSKHDPREEIRPANLTGPELIIGKRICNALKKKSERFLTFENLKQKFAAERVFNTCAEQVPKAKVRFNLMISNVTSKLEYVPESDPGSFISNVVTDSAEAIKDFCDNMRVSETVSNRIVSPTVTYSIVFLNENDVDYYKLKKKVIDATGKVIRQSADIVYFYTQETQAAIKFHGIEKERFIYTSCDDQLKYAHVAQTWVGPLTSFEN